MGSMIRSLVLYEPPNGSIEKIARAITREIQLNLGEAECQNNDVDAETVSQYDLIAAGSATKSFLASRSMKDFLQRLEGKNLAESIVSRSTLDRTIGFHLAPQDT